MKLAAVATALAFYTGGIKPYGALREGDLERVARLSASRGETINFTLRVPPGECFMPRVSFPSDKAPRYEARFYEILPFKTVHPSYRGAKPGTYWDAVIPRGRICPGSEGKWILGELKIDRSAQPGTFHGTISGHSTSLPLELKIWKMQMPEAPSVPMYAELTTWFLLLGHYGKWHEGESELARKYIDRMLEHRIAPLKHWIRADSFVKDVAAPLPGWAKLSLPLGQSLKPQDPTARDYVTQIVREAENAGISERSFAYLWDEPHAEDMSALKKLATMVRSLAPRLKLLITMTYDKAYASLVDIWVPVMDQYDRKGFAPPADYAAEQKRGKEVWLYASCMSHGCGNDTDSGSPDWVIDRPGPHIRSQGWIAQKYRLDGLLYYSVDNGYQFFQKGRDPWTNLWDFSGNGDGTLFYPGRPGLHGLTEHVPVESLRLKLWRQSSYDADYAQMMNRLGSPPDWWPKRLHSLVKSVREWSKSDRDYRELRESIGDYLNSR